MQAGLWSADEFYLQLPEICGNIKVKDGQGGGFIVARLSDSIEEFIKAVIAATERGEAEIQRNELASRFNCVPSQINYVIATRFSRDKGYIVESRRGGGGCIRICRVTAEDGVGAYIMGILESMGESVSQHGAGLIIGSLFEKRVITEREAKVMLSAVNDKTFRLVRPQDRDLMRAEILKGMLMTVVRM